MWNVTSVLSDDTFVAVRKLPKDLEKVLVTTSSYFSPSQRHKSPQVNTRNSTPKTSQLVRKAFQMNQNSDSSNNATKPQGGINQIGDKMKSFINDKILSPIPVTQIPLNMNLEGSKAVSNFGTVSYKMISTEMGFTFKVNTSNVDAGYKWNNMLMSAVLDLSNYIYL